MNTIEKMHYVGNMRKQNLPVRVKIDVPERWGTKTAIIYRVDVVDYYIIFKDKKGFSTRKILIGDFDIGRKVSAKDVPYWNEIIYKQNLEELEAKLNANRKEKNKLWESYDEYAQKLNDLT